jgi:DNA adenine methylase
LYWAKEPSAKEVVNDLDATLISDYKRVKRGPSDPDAYRRDLTTTSKQSSFISKYNSKVADQITESIIRRCNGFAGTYIDGSKVAKPSNPKGKTDKIKQYQDRMKNTTFLNKDYRKVLSQYDSPTTFFFMDPPYEESKGFDYAEEEGFDFEALASAVRKLKGKFLITINDSPRIRKLFAGFKITPYVVKGHHSEKVGVGVKDRPELFISNYH